MKTVLKVVLVLAGLFSAITVVQQGLLGGHGTVMTAQVPGGHPIR